MSEDQRQAHVGNGRILVVDDDQLILRSLKRVLRQHAVDLASSAAEALGHFDEQGAYSLVLCDLSLDETASGIDLYRTLASRGDGAQRAVVFMTGWPKDADREFLEGIENPHIMKPFNIAEVRALAERMVGAPG